MTTLELYNDLVSSSNRFFELEEEKAIRAKVSNGLLTLEQGYAEFKAISYGSVSLV